jgi:DNA polymerase phi
MKREPKNELFLRLIVPLVDLISNTSTDERQLSDKANGILRSQLQKHKEKLVIADTDAAVAILKTLHERARKAPTAEILSTIDLCSLFVAKCLVGMDEQAIVQAYQDSIIDFVKRKSSALQPLFVVNFFRRMPSVAWKTRAVLITSSDDAVNGFRQSQLFNFAQVLLTAIAPNVVSFCGLPGCAILTDEIRKHTGKK